MASFTGSSLVAVETPAAAVNRLEIHASVRPLGKEGIILYNQGEREEKEGGGGADFLSLSLKDG